MNGERLDSRWVRTVQAACNCRRGYLCAFCRRWTMARRYRTCRTCGGRLELARSMERGECLECRLLAEQARTRQETSPGPSGRERTP